VYAIYILALAVAQNMWGQMIKGQQKINRKGLGRKWSLIT
jgi:hypothetical protein